MVCRVFRSPKTRHLQNLLFLLSTSYFEWQSSPSPHSHNSSTFVLSLKTLLLLVSYISLLSFSCCVSLYFNCTSRGHLHTTPLGGNIALNLHSALSKNASMASGSPAHFRLRRQEHRAQPRLDVLSVLATWTPWVWPHLRHCKNAMEAKCSQKMLYSPM